MMEGVLDIETMGNPNNAAITAIGLVVADKEGTLFRYYTPVSLQSSVDAGGVMDVSTVLWWMNQSEEARSLYKVDGEKPSLKSALEGLINFTQNVCGIGDKGEHLLRLWGNGVSFDNVILKSAIKSVGLEDPYAFWNDSCYRTLKGLYPKIKLERVGTHHNALDDAESQMMHLLKILEKVNE